MTPERIQDFEVSAETWKKNTLAAMPDIKNLGHDMAKKIIEAIPDEDRLSMGAAMMASATYIGMLDENGRNYASVGVLMAAAIEIFESRNK